MPTARKTTAPKSTGAPPAARKPAARSAKAARPTVAEAEAPLADTLGRYREKRDFTRTPEPEGRSASAGHAYVIQKHWASRLHYDLRLQIGGAMKSWAVPKGPSLDPHDKRMAVQVEDHPVAYNRFEGQIPAGAYGAGKVIVWDKGWWEPEGDAQAGWDAGKLKFTLHGHKLQGRWTLVRMGGHAAEKQPPWLLIKEDDAFARPAATYSVVEAEPDSVGALPAIEREASGAKPSGPAAQQPSSPAPTAQAQELPEALTPQLATLVDAPPADAADWLFELKFDGYRMLARCEGGAARLVTRNAHDWTDRMPGLARALQALPLQSGWIDGEVVVLGEDGAPDFQALQNAFDARSSRLAQARLVYFVFDLPFADGEDLRGLPLEARRERLQALLAGQPADGPVRFSAAFAAVPQELVASACRIGFEGVIGKRRDAPYHAGRSSSWIKLKCGKRQEFVIGGWTDPKGTRTGVGALLLGVHEADGSLRYAGNVGSGFSAQTLADLAARLAPLAATENPFAGRPRLPGHPHWVRPELLAEVSFAQWTETGRVRHAVFHGLRDDKPARAIVQEQAMPIPTEPAPRHQAAPRAQAASVPPAGTQLEVTHADRVVDAESGLRKIDLVRYYATVAPLMLPHLAQRPVSVVRAPAGVAGQHFFQKHADSESLPGALRLDPALDPGHPPLIGLEDAQALVAAAQMNVLEFHTWNARVDRIERPDRMTFDIDPGEGVPWEQVQQAAQLVKVVLDEQGLPAFLKTSGGKGLHVVVPIKRLLGWDTVKDFSQRVVQHLAATIPDRFVAKSGPKNRVGKIFVDYLRNGRGATTVAAWSARARPGLGISVPVRWDELPQLTGGAHWTVASVDERLRIGNTPWDGYEQAAVSLGAAIKRLGA